MKLKALLLFLFVPLICSATDINVDPSTFKATYEGAKDGDVLLMEEGTYTGDINLPDGKTVTLKAAEGAEVVFGVKFRGSDASVTGGGIIMEGLVIKPNDSYFMDLTYGDIKTITLHNCDLSAINRCFLRTNNEGHVIDKIEMDRCIIHDCGDGGYNFIYPKHGVREVSVTNSTLYNYKGGESFFSPNSMNVDIDMLFTFSNNTVYKWSKASKYAICNTGNKVGLFSEYTFRNNIIYKAGVDGQTPNILNTTGGYLLAEKNLIADYGTYNQASAADTEISDYTLADFGLTNIPFPDPENGDFSITSESPMATAATDGGPIGTNLTALSFCECICHTAAQNQVVNFSEQVFDDTNLCRYLRTTHDGSERTLDVAENIVNGVNFFFHQISQHLVVAVKVFVDNSC